MTATPVVPRDVRAMLGDVPAIGTWEQMFPLLTVDEAGFPHVCLLSRAELQADSRRICAVLASRQTIANVSRDGKATLVAVGPDTAFYVKLSVEDSLSDGHWLGIACGVAAVKQDSLQIPLRPAKYLVTDALSVNENWARSQQLLVRLRKRN